MARAGRKRVESRRERSGKVSRSTEAIHLRGGSAYACWLVYFITAGGFTKVGYSGQLAQRIGNVGRGVGAICRLTGSLKVRSENQAKELESDIHAHLKAKGFLYEGEWFDMDDRDVIKTIEAFAGRGEVISSINQTAAPPRILSPKHHFSDANGRKFLAS